MFEAACCSFARNTEEDTAEMHTLLSYTDFQDGKGEQQQQQQLCRRKVSALGR